MKRICVVTSDWSHGRSYVVETSSAMKCAKEFGRCEGGECVTVYNYHGTWALSCVRWMPENGGKYCRVAV